MAVRAEGEALPPLSVPTHAPAGPPRQQDPSPLLPLGTRFVKRSVDLVGGLILLIVCAPLLLVVAAAVFITDPGPIRFRQVRVGLNGAPFRVSKFRTMVVDAEERLHSDPELLARYHANDHKLPPAEDPRLTRTGQFLRATSLDELPQLLNVVWGTMSLVGPRPILYSEVPRYGELWGTVSAVKPGLTGLWQVSGRSEIVFPQRAELDATYATSVTLRGDLSIMFRTLGVVVRRHGAW